MRIFLLLFSGLITLLSCTNSRYRKADWKPGDHLFPVTRNDRWGFINQSGAEVIEPKFRDVGPFTDSLTAARLDGTWGFINPKGAFVIPPIYDYVMPFSEGLAAAWKEGKPMFINSAGQKAFALTDSIVDLSFFIDGKALLKIWRNDSLFYVTIDKTGTVLPEKERETNPEYPCVVTRERPAKGDENKVTEFAVKDSLGQLLVPFGRYDNIENFHNGLAEVTIELPKIDYYKQGFINRKGELVFMLPVGSTVSYFMPYFSEGLIAVNTAVDSTDYINSPDYITWYDSIGKIVMVKKNDKQATSFRNNRSFSGEIRNWYLMDKKGNQLSTNRFEWVPDDGFNENMAIVAALDTSYDIWTHDRYGVIDTMGNYIIPPQFNEVHKAGFQSEGLLVSFKEPHRKGRPGSGYQPVKQFWGLIDRKGNWVFPAEFTVIGSKGFENGLLYAEKDSLYGYIDPAGKFVWSAIRAKDFREAQLLNVDCMQRAYCYGFPGEETQAHAEEDYPRNYARRGALGKRLKDGQLGIVVKTDESARFRKKYQGITAYVYNSGPDTLNIDVQDNRLYLVMQALHPKGTWQNIEYAPSSWCGNSYFGVALLPDEYWKFDIPVYDGDIPVTLRLAFTWKRNWKSKKLKTQTVYSNTFSGKINPAQYWREQGHFATSIMDPYDN